MRDVHRVLTTVLSESALKSSESESFGAEKLKGERTKSCPKSGSPQPLISRWEDFPELHSSSEI